MTSKEKKTCLFLLIGFGLFAAFVNFYCTNLVLSDVANGFFQKPDKYTLSSIPGLMFSILLDALLVFIYKYYRFKSCRKSLIKSYSITAVVISAIGIVGCFITGTYVYGSFTKPYPFYGYTTLFLIVFIATIMICILQILIYIPKIKEDNCRIAMGPKYVIYNICLYLLLYYALFKFGAFLWSPIYIQWRSIGSTFSFYLSLLLPITAIFNLCIKLLGVTTNESKLNFKIAHVHLIASVVLFSTVIVSGFVDTQYISAVSPAVGLERLASIPATTILFGIIFLLISVFSFIAVIHNKEVKIEIKEN